MRLGNDSTKRRRNEVKIKNQSTFFEPKISKSPENLWLIMKKFFIKLLYYETFL